jgi:hypothetical protein
MTVAIAAEFPWGEWRKVTDSLPFGHWERAVFLAADTRWSYCDGGREDRGRKLWTLGRQVGLVMAGDVWSGEEGIRRLREAAQNARFRHATDVAALAEKVFRETYRVHEERAGRNERLKPDGLRYLMGLVDANAYTALVLLSNETSFRPTFLSDVQCIGMPTARDSARKFLLEQEGKMKSRDNLDRDPTTWAIKVAAAVDSIIVSGTEPSVGGGVQLVVGDKNGWREVPVSILRDGGSPEVASDWRDATYPLASLISAEGSGLRRLAACETVELGIEQIA